MAATPLNSDYFDSDSLSVAVTRTFICTGTDDAPPDEAGVVAFHGGGAAPSWESFPTAPY